MKTEQYNDELTELHGTSIRVVSYKIGDEYHCHVSNADPGATIARASAASKETALKTALKKAEQRLSPKVK
jgi:hypothetical protein